MLTGNLLRELTREALYTDASFPDLAEIWQLVDESAAASASRLSDAVAAQFPEVPEDNGFASPWAVFCDDADWPESPRRYRRDVRTDIERFPVAGGMARTSGRALRGRSSPTRIRPGSAARDPRTCS